MKNKRSLRSYYVVYDGVKEKYQIVYQDRHHDPALFTILSEIEPVSTLQNGLMFAEILNARQQWAVDHG